MDELKKIEDWFQESPMTCANCNAPVLWKRIEGTDEWELEIPCVHCGSQKFNVRVDNPRAHCQIFGLNG